MTIARSITLRYFLALTAALLMAACTSPEPPMTDEHMDIQTNQEPSMCKEHMGSQVTVFSDGFPTTNGEMFYCYGDNGFMIIRDDDTIISFPYHRVVAVQTTSQDFLEVTPE